MIQTTTKNKAKDGASAVLFGYQEICRVLDNPLHEVFNWAEKEKSSCFPGENGGKEKNRRMAVRFRQESEDGC